MEICSTLKLGLKKQIQREREMLFQSPVMIHMGREELAVGVSGLLVTNNFGK